MKRQLQIEIDGPGVSPETIDARTALELAAATISLMEVIAERAGKPLVFRGLEIQDKCVAIATGTTNVDVAQIAEAAQGYISNERIHEKELFPQIKRVRSAIGRIGLARSAKLILSDRALALTVPIVATETYPLARTVIRAELTRIGGAQCKAVLRSDFELAPFTLSVAKKVARELAKHLYAEVEIVAEVQRGGLGAIEKGRVIDFREVTDPDEPMAVLEDWFQSSGAKWADIEDVSEELGRGD